MKRPLLPVALCYAAGLIVARWLLPPLPFLFVAAFALLGLAVAWSAARPFLLWPLIFVTGWVNMAAHTAIISPNDLRTLIGSEPQIVSIRGRLLETPSLRVFERDETESFRTLAQVAVTELHRGEAWQRASGKIMVMTPETLPAHFFNGQNVEIKGALAIPSLPVAPGLFDYRAHLAHQGIYYQLKPFGADEWAVAAPAVMTPPFSERFLAWAQKTLAYGLPTQDEPLRLMWAMTLGWKTALTGEVNEPFMRSGTMHIFAISGLHIALIAGILVALLRVMRVPRWLCGWLVIPLIWFYTMATGYQSSAIRSTLMMTIIIGGWSLRRPSDLINSLAAAGLIILVWDPLQLVQASFQLSFFVVLAIALLSPILNRWCERLFKMDPLLPLNLAPRWKRYAHGAFRFVAMSVAASIAAWLGSLMLTASYFHLASPVALLANLLIVPLSSLTLMSNLGSLVCGDWFPWATSLFNHSGWLFMDWMMGISRWVTKWPGAYFYVATPLISLLVAYHLFLLIAAVSGWSKSRYRGWIMAGLAVAVGIFFWEWHHARSQTLLTVIPLNGGHAAFIDDQGGKNDWLIDCGNTNAVEFVTKPFLHAHGVNRIPRLLLTHGDLQHVGGTETLHEEFGIGQIYTSSARFRSPVYRRIMERLDESWTAHRVINRTDVAGAWEVLHPDTQDKFPQGDNNTLVLRGGFQGTRVLLLSDLGRPGQETLLNRTNDLRADIVVAGLPEKGEPLCDALLAAISPRLIIIADSEYPAHKRAGESLRNRLQSHKIPILYTRNAGAVTFAFQRDAWKFYTASDGWQSLNNLSSSSPKP